MRQLQQTKQQQVLSTAMRQSLEILRMPAAELHAFLLEEAQENLFLQVEEPEFADAADLFAPETLPYGDWPEYGALQSPGAGKENSDPAECMCGTESFTDYLLEQLMQDKSIPREYLAACCYLVQNLNRRGWLEDSLDSLSGCIGVPVRQMEQALYIVQSLSPAGVGARGLEECLILQLAQTKDFSAETLALIRRGLELVAKNDFRAAALELNVSAERAKKCCEAIRRLNPIPSRGFSTGETVQYVSPEAEVTREGDRLAVRYLESAQPKVSLEPAYVQLLEETRDPALERYLAAHRRRAQALIEDVEQRKRTLLRVLQCVLESQYGYFLHGPENLQPLTAQAVAQKLGVNASTVSRAIQGKSIVCAQGTVPVKSLFSAKLDRQEASSASARERLRLLIRAEDKTAPLSDEQLKQALGALGIRLSRRTVAKYRKIMDIPAATMRGCLP